MTTLQSPTLIERPSRTSLLGESTGELVFRLAGGPHVGRLVRVAAAKCTIGSAPDCTLRLRAPGVLPVHCLVLRGGNKTIVRRWNRDTLLNDCPFDEAELNIGDRLTIGSVQLQLKQILPSATAARRPEPKAAKIVAPNELRLAERLALANRQGRSRVRAVLAKLRKYQLRLSEVDARRTQIAEDQARLELERTRLQAREQELQIRSAEVETLRRTAEEFERTQTERLAELRGRREETLQALAVERDAIAAERRELAVRSAAVGADSAAVAERLQDCAAREADLDRRAAAAAEQLREGERLRGEADAERRELALHAAEIATQRAELEGARAEFAAARNAWDVERCALAERETRVNRRAEEVERMAAATQAELERLQKQLSDEQVAAERAAAESRAVREAELSERERAADVLTGSLTERLRDLELRERLLAEREANVTLGESAMQQTQATNLRQAEEAAAQAAESLQRLEADLGEKTRRLTKLEAEVAGRCEALKRHWHELTGREAWIERDRAALAEQQAELNARQAELQAAVEAMATMQAVVAEPVPTSTTSPETIVMSAADSRAESECAATDWAAAQADRADELRRLTDALAERQAEFNRVAAEFEAERERFTAEKLAEQAALAEARVADADRRAVVELAARVVELRAELIAAEARELETIQTLAVAAASIVEIPVTTIPEDKAVETAEAATRVESPAATESESMSAPEETVVVAEETAREPQPSAVANKAATESDDDAEQALLEFKRRYGLIDDAAQTDNSSASNDRPDAVEPAEVAATPTPSAPETPKTESASDVLRRLGLGSALGEPEPPPAASSPPAPPTPIAAATSQPVPSTAKPPAASGRHEGDEQLDDYMQQLFKRLGVRQNDAATAAGATPTMPSGANSVESPAATSAPVVPLSADEFKARSVAAERKSDLSVLRELANVQAKTAITKHEIKRETGASKWKLMVAGGSFCVGFYCAYMYWTGLEHARYGMFAGLAVAGMFLLQSVGLNYQAKKSARTLDDVLEKSNARGRSTAGGESPKSE